MFIYATSGRLGQTGTAVLVVGMDPDSILDVEKGLRTGQEDGSSDR